MRIALMLNPNKERRDHDACLIRCWRIVGGADMRWIGSELLIVRLGRGCQAPPEGSPHQGQSLKGSYSGLCASCVRTGPCATLHCLASRPRPYNSNARRFSTHRGPRLNSGLL